MTLSDTDTDSRKISISIPAQCTLGPQIGTSLSRVVAIAREYLLIAKCFRDEGRCRDAKDFSFVRQKNLKW